MPQLPCGTPSLGGSDDKTDRQTAMRTVTPQREPATSKLEARLTVAEANAVQRAAKAPWRLNEKDARELAAMMRSRAQALVFVARHKSEFSLFLTEAGRARVEAEGLARFINSYPAFLADFGRTERMHRLNEGTSIQRLRSLATLLKELATALAKNGNAVRSVQAMRHQVGPGSPSARTLCAASLAGLWLGWLRSRQRPEETISWACVAEFTDAACDVPNDPEHADSLKRAVVRAKWPGVPMGNRPVSQGGRSLENRNI